MLLCVCRPVQVGQDVVSERLRTISEKSLFRCNRFSCDYNPTYVACITQQNCLFFLKHPVVTAGVSRFGIRSLVVGGRLWVRWVFKGVFVASGYSLREFALSFVEGLVYGHPAIA